MITITRLLAKQIKSVLRQLFGRTRYRQPPVVISSGPQGLLISCCDGLRGFEYRDAMPQPECSLRATFELFKQLAGTKQVFVELTPVTDGEGVLARWQDGSIPCSKQFEPSDSTRDLVVPTLPETFAENPPAALSILHEAMLTIAKDPFRFATDLIQLRGKDGMVVATNGHHLLVQRGLALGWEEEIVCHATRLFGCADLLPQDQAVLIGKSADYVAVRTGPWTFYLGIEQERRYPAVDHTIWPPEAAKTTWELSPLDAQFLTEQLPRIPGAEEDTQPITLDLNGQVAIRAQSATDDAPTELRLRNSSSTGDATRVAIDRRFLLRAINLGFERIHFCDPGQSILCADASRSYLWMPLHPESSIPTSRKALVIESPHAGETPAAPASVSISTPIQRNVPMNTTTPPPAETTPAAAPRRKRTSATASPAPGPIEQTIALRDQLRTLLSQTNQLVKSLKKQRQQQRLMQTTLASLKQLQAAG